MSANDLPDELPAQPEGFTQQLVCHLNFGRKGAAATYTIRDPRGVELPLQFGYRTGKDAFRGFFLIGAKEPMTWAQVRAAWPAYVRALRRLETRGLSAKEALAHVRDERPLTMVVIYDHPRDLPGGFVVREWTITPGAARPTRLLGQDLATLDAARELVPPGLVNIGRRDDDDPRIAEVWT